MSDPEFFKCEHCTFSTNIIKYYVNHYDLHRNVHNISFPCGISSCNKRLKSYGNLKSHMFRDHQFTKQKCSAPGIAKNLKCSLSSCSTVSSDFTALVNHIKEHIDLGVTMTCPVEKCDRKYSNIKSFRSHLTRIHWAVMNTLKTFDLAEHENKSVIESGATSMNEETSTSEEVEGMIVNDIEGSTLKDNILKNMGLFYLKLECKYLVPATVVQGICEEILRLSKLNNEIICKKVEEKLTSCSLAASEIQQVLNEINNNNCMSINNTEYFLTDYKRKSFYKSHFSNYVDPIKLYLGLNKLKRPSFCQYVPIRQTLQILMSNSSIKQLQNTYASERVVDGSLRDIWDGTVFKGIHLFEQLDSLPIILYQDAFEVVNPLGSAKKTHKVIGVYFSLASLPPFYRCNSENIQLVLLCKESDFKFFGQSKVFSLLLNDLKELESTGILLDGKICKGTVCSIVGDNLGSHCIGGFLESFNGQYMCRYCLLTKEQFAVRPCSIGPPRTVDSYEASVENIVDGGSSEGIKFSSLFNELEHFHVSLPGLPPCLGHDLFEGVVAYDLKLYLDFFVKKKKWFSFQSFNFIVLNFQYKGTDSRNKPCEVDEKKKKISGHAAQTWCLLRLLPLLIGQYIDNYDDTVWELCLLLRTIVEVICAPRITKFQIIHLHTQIEEYIFLRAKTFPSHPLRPKHHYLIHYPRLIVQFGPLIQSWTLRFESKHSYFKRCARQSKNFKNICSTLALRHQLLQTYIHAHDSPYLSLTYDKSNEFHIDLYKDEIKRAVPHNFLPSNTQISYNVNIKGTNYKKGYFLPLFHNESISFGRILLMLIKDGKDVYFAVEVFTTTSFPQFGLYELLEPKEIIIKKFEDFPDYYPLPNYEMNSTSYISLHHAFDNLT